MFRSFSRPLHRALCKPPSPAPAPNASLASLLPLSSSHTTLTWAVGVAFLSGTAVFIWLATGPLNRGLEALTHGAHVLSDISNMLNNSDLPGAVDMLKKVDWPGAVKVLKNSDLPSVVDAIKKADVPGVAHAIQGVVHGGVTIRIDCLSAHIQATKMSSLKTKMHMARKLVGIKDRRLDDIIFKEQAKFYGRETRKRADASNTWKGFTTADGKMISECPPPALSKHALCCVLGSCGQVYKRIVSMEFFFPSEDDENEGVEAQ